MYWAWTSAYRDLTSADDTKFINDLNSSPKMDSLRTSIDNILDFALHAPEMPGSFRRPLKVHTKLARHQFDCWKRQHWLLHAVSLSRCSAGHILRVSLVVFLALQIVFIAAEPNIVAHILDEPDFNARSIQNRVRTALQVYMLIRFPYTTPRLLWTYLVKRQAVPYGVTIAYTVVAFHPGYTALYDKTWFKIVAGLSSFAGQLAMTFPMTTWRACEAKRRTKALAFSDDTQCRITELHTSLASETKAFHELVATSSVSRHMQSQISNMSSDLDIINCVLQDGVPSNSWVTQSQPQNPRAPKSIIWMASFVVFGLNCVCYAATSFLLVNVAATAAFVLLIQGEVVRQHSQSLEEMLGIFSNLTSGNILTLPFVGIPVLIATRAFGYRLMKNSWAFWSLSIIQTVLNLTISDLFGPMALRCARRQRWLAKDGESATETCTRGSE